jgi:hypothetical protein
MLEDAPDFAPVPREHSRYDGWTPAPQRAVVKQLGEHRCVRRAATALVIASSVTALRAHAQATLSGPLACGQRRRRVRGTEIESHELYAGLLCRDAPRDDGDGAL